MDSFQPPTREEIISNLGPLAALAGTWEGAEGFDVAPSDDRGREENKFRETLKFEPFGPVDNHEQRLWGLRYSTIAWRKGEDNPFHEESGYWLWDPKEKQVIRAFIVPRGVTVLAGGTVEPGARTFQLKARCGQGVYGISSNPFLDREFKTEEYSLTVRVVNDQTFEYEETTFLRMVGKSALFEHTDRNRMIRVKA